MQPTSKSLTVGKYMNISLNIMQKTEGRKITSGTKEWADHNVNLIDGCSHDCRYCYAKGSSIPEFALSQPSLVIRL